MNYRGQRNKNLYVIKHILIFFHRRAGGSPGKTKRPVTDSRAAKSESRFTISEAAFMPNLKYSGSKNIVYLPS